MDPCEPWELAEAGSCSPLGHFQLLRLGEGIWLPKSSILLYSHTYFFSVVGKNSLVTNVKQRKENPRLQKRGQFDLIKLPCLPQPVTPLPWAQRKPQKGFHCVSGSLGDRDPSQGK